VSIGGQTAVSGSLASQPRVRRPWTPELPGWAAGLLSAPIAISFLLLVFYPMAKLVQESFGKGNLNAYAAALVDPVKLRALGTTLWVSGAVTMVSLLLAFVLAWSLRTSQSRLLKSLIWFGLLMPMAMSSVVQNYVWIVILGRRGVLNDMLGHIGVPPLGLLYTPGAVLIAMVYTLLPFAVFPLLVTFSTIPDRVLRAAESLGGGWLTTMRTVVLPLSVPGLFITGVLVFVLSVGFYVTPIIMGGPKATFLAKVIQDDLLMRFDRPAASATSVIMMIVALGIVTIAIKIVGRERFERSLG
jgi:putative spermidine/putrescine transport system permease protein